MLAVGRERAVLGLREGNLGRLPAGEFYLALEGSAFQRIRTPMCLSYHPSSPLTEDEVLARAAG